MKKSRLPCLIEAFFTDRLLLQRRASPHTIASYRDTFRLIFRYAQQRLQRQPSNLRLEDLDVPFLTSFLEQLEITHGVTARTRNQRLAAIRSFFRYVSFEEPGHAALIQRILAIPSKRQDRALVDYLTRDEVEALLQAPNRGSRQGRRDHTLIYLAAETGLRVSEIVALQCQDVILGTGAHVHCRGKGRKERCTPLTKSLALCIANWLNERAGAASDPLFPNARGGRLSPDGVQYLLHKHVLVAARSCPTLNAKRVSPHVLRHTAAMTLLESGVDRSVIALWLGHENPETTQVYLAASLALKEAALQKAVPIGVKPGRFRPDDELMAFLNGL